MNPLIHKRQQILQQMELVTRIEHGSFQAEKRTSVRHPNLGRGPYYKHQVWENGQNLTRRVPVEQADALAQALGFERTFRELILRLRANCSSLSFRRWSIIRFNFSFLLFWVFRAQIL